MMELGLRAWARLTFSLPVVTGLVLVATVPAALAQDARKEPTSPVGGVTWSTKINPDTTASPGAPAGATLDRAQLDLVQRVSAYFNQLDNVKGTFVQTGPDNKRMRGRFYIKRPGRLRFEYALPSKQLIVSDGEMVAIQDLDINTDDRIALDQTPFRVLLGKDVDLLRDARILDAQESEDLAVVALQDKSPDAPGRIKLFLSKGPQLELKEWVTTDAQGLDTRVEVSGLIKTEEIDVALFKITSPQIRNLQKNQ